MLHEDNPVQEPYEALVRTIAYQQLHANAGDTILSCLLIPYPRVPFPVGEIWTLFRTVAAWYLWRLPSRQI